MEFIYSIEMINGSFTPVRKEEIVRCKDCKYRIELPCVEDWVCNHNYGCLRCYDDDFCPFGERKETE